MFRKRKEKSMTIRKITQSQTKRRQLVDIQQFANIDNLNISSEKLWIFD